MATDGNLEVNHTLPCTTRFAYVRCPLLEHSYRDFIFVDSPPFPNPYGSSAFASLSEEQKVGDSISEWIKEA